MNLVTSYLKIKIKNSYFLYKYVYLKRVTKTCEHTFYLGFNGYRELILFYKFYNKIIFSGVLIVNLNLFM